MQDIEQMLKKNTGYLKSPQLKLLKDDLERFLNPGNERTAELKQTGENTVNPDNGLE